MATLKAMFKLFDGYSRTADAIELKTKKATDKILEASGATDKLNKKLEQTGASADKGSSGLGKYLSIAAIVAGAIKGMNIADEYMNTSARLDLINDGLQTQAQLQEKIFASAKRAKGSYTDMANAISKMGLLAGDAFGSNNELIAFTELVQKSFKVGGASQSEQSSALLQLTQAMSAGKLQGDEFRSIMENAPMIADAIAKYTGKSKGDLKELSADGLITSDIIKNAMFMAADDINAKFTTMPTTFADIWNSIKNGGLRAFGPIIRVVNKLINSQGFQAVVDGIVIGINLISLAVETAIDFITANWPLIQSLLMATGIYLAATLGPRFVMAGILGLKSGLMAAAGWMAAHAPMMMIISVLALILYGLMQAGVTFEDVFGFIGGVVGVAVAGIWNLFIGLFDLILGVVNYLVNPFINFANFIGNVFTNPISSIIYLFQGMADGVLAILEKIASALDFVFGSKMADSVAGWRSGLKDMTDAAVAKYAPNENYQKVMDSLDLSASDFGLERMDYSESWSAGEKVGKDVFGKLEGALKKLTEFQTGDDAGTEYNPTVIEGLGEGGKVKVDMSDEDLKYLRDIAERDYINKFSTATLAPQISFSFGDIHEEADAEKIKGRIEYIMREEIAMAAEGSY